MKTKISLFVCLFVGITFLGCTKDDSLVPGSQNDEILKSKKIPTQFTGTCESLDDGWDDDNDGVIDAVAFYDNASDERVTGASKWYTTLFNQIDDITFEMAGTAEIFVGAETKDDIDNGNYHGKWEMTWKATQTLTSPDGSTFRIVGQGVGAGTEGNVLGLTARWKYTMDFDGSPESFMYVSKGKITEPF